jgi:heat shock protein HslJ/membrane-bound inhibitor of C-type lysozyme
MHKLWFLIAAVVSATAGAQSTPPSSRFIESVCDNDVRINVRFEPNSATVLYRGLLATLRETPSGSGYRYTDGRWTLSGKGTSSLLEGSGGAVLASQCEGGAFVSGTVTYQQRVALPDNAVLTVQLEDVSRADASSTVLAAQTVSTRGQQVPLQWGFVFDPKWLEPNGRYVLRATITSAGRSLWTTDTATLLPQGGAAGLELRLVQAQGSPVQTPGSSDPLRGTAWVLSSYTPAGGARTNVSGDARPTISFDGARAGGSTGCNTYGGAYTVDGSTLKLGQLVQTLRACADPVGRLEAAFTRLLQDVNAYSVSGNTLTLTTATGGALTFTAQSGTASSGAGTSPTQTGNPRLAGTNWQLTRYTLNGTTVTVTAARSATIGFDANGRASGSTGCNRFTGGYTSSVAGVLTLTPLATTRMACVGEGASLERAFLTLIQGVTRYAGDASTITLTSSTGTMVFKRVQQ